MPLFCTSRKKKKRKKANKTPKKQKPKRICDTLHKQLTRSVSCPSLKTGVIGGKVALRSENYAEVVEYMFLYSLFCVAALGLITA